MLTKFYLDIDGASTEIPQVCVKNWDDIKCSYKRSDFSGVTRSFTSQFEFVGEAYDTLMSLYLRDGFNAQATFKLYTITDRWEWRLQFACVLDFSTINWDNHTLKINCIDNSLEALIKANKGTSYEWLVDDDLPSNGTMTFKRLPMKNSVTYQFTGGETDDVDGSLVLDEAVNNRVYVGVVSDDEVYINRVLDWNDDQSTDADSYMIQAYRVVYVEVEFSIQYDRSWSNSGGSMLSTIKILHTDGTETAIASLNVSNNEKLFVGIYDSEEALKIAYPSDKIHAESSMPYWALVADEVWEVRQNGSASQSYWYNTHKDASTYRHYTVRTKATASLLPNDRIILYANNTTKIHIYTSDIKISWMASGEAVTMPCYKPITIANAVLKRVSDGKVNAVVSISDFDTRLANTYIVAAESIRGIDNAKLYTSFTQFADWMATVFGYTYYIGDAEENTMQYHRNALGGIVGTPYGIDETPWMSVYNEPPTEDEIYYCSWCGKFAAHKSDGNYHCYFPGWENYNDESTLLARTDTVYTIKQYVGGEYVNTNYYFVADAETTINYTPVEYEYDLDTIGKPLCTVHFVHRSELFSAEANVKHINRVRDVQYSVDTSTIYSAINIGYEKKDYESINGRDEFNFNNTYTTGCSVSDKTLSLLSKYRADSYGFEFAAQKRGEDTTDTSADNDVFFALCKRLDDGTIVPDTSIAIENAISDVVFNGAFSPMACLKANAGYICMQSSDLHLQFASSDGNSDVVVDGVAVSSDIDLSERLITSGVVQFTTDDVDEPASFSDIVEFESNGVVYRGFVLEATYRYGKVEAVDYKLIVKDIKL